MAERRMFAKRVVTSDRFLEMPVSAQALYFHLGIQADDDGFVGGPRTIQKTIGVNDDDLKLLIAKRFIIPFESGVVVIRDWKKNNLIKNDRYKQTDYQEEKRLLSCTETGEYQIVGTQMEPKWNPNGTNLEPKWNPNGTNLEPKWNPNGTQMEPKWNPNGTQMEPQDRLGKVNLNSIDNTNIISINTLDSNSNYKHSDIVTTSNKLNNKKRYAEFVYMTEYECQKLVDEYGKEITEELITILDNYKGSTGKEYASDYRAILSWVVRRYKEEHRCNADRKKETIEEKAERLAKEIGLDE